MGNQNYLTHLAAIPQGGVAIVQSTQAGYPTACVAKI